MAETLSIKVIGDVSEAVRALHELGKAGIETSKESTTLTGKVFHGVTGVLKKGALVTGAAVSGILSASLIKGFQRVDAIENAEAKLKGLGNSAKNVKIIMDNALKSVLGTQFGLGEAATTAAGAVAAGIKPGQQLKHYLDAVANSAASSGMSMQDMGNIFNKVAAQGKAHNDVLEQVANRGIPIYTALGKVLHKTGDQVFDMAKHGEIGLKQFQAGMTVASGTVAKELGGTVSGTFQNVGAAMSRFGARILQDFFPMLKKGMDGTIKLFDNLTKKVGPSVDKAAKGLNVFLNALQGNSKVDKFTGKLRTINNVGNSLYHFFLKVKDAAQGFWNGLTSGKSSKASQEFQHFEIIGIRIRAMISSLVSSAKKLWSAFGPLVKELGNSVLKNSPSTFKLIMVAMNLLVATVAVLTDFMTQHKVIFSALIVAVTAGYAAYRTFSTVMKVAQGITKAYTIAMGLLDAVMNANPVMLVVVAIAALAAGLIYAYKHSETFRKIVDGAFHAIAQAAHWLWQQFKTNFISPILNGFANVTDGIASFLGALGNIPGFGWAKTAADKMHGAAKAARDMARDIRDIPDKSVNITVTHRDIFISQHTVQGVSVPSHMRIKGFASGGTDIPAGLAWVGEQGPELMYVPGGSTIYDNKTSLKMANGSGHIASGIGSAGVHIQIDVHGNIWAAKDLAKELANPIRDELVKIGKRNGGNIFPNGG